MNKTSGNILFALLLFSLLLAFGCLKEPNAAVKSDNSTLSKEENKTSPAGQAIQAANNESVDKKTKGFTMAASIEQDLLQSLPPNLTNASNFSGNSNVTTQPANSSPPNSTPLVTVYYFYSLICPYSTDASKFLDQLMPKYNASQVSLIRKEIYYNPPNFESYAKFFEAYNIPKNLFVVPMAYINGTYIYTNGSIRDELEGRIDACLETKSCPDPMENVVGKFPG